MELKSLMLFQKPVKFVESLYSTFVISVEHRLRRYYLGYRLGCLAGGINKSGSFRAVAISSRDPHSLNPIPLGEKRSYLNRCRAHVVSWNASWPRTRHFESLRADHPINWTFRSSSTRD